MSELEDDFLGWWRMLAPGYPEPEREYKFSPHRKWRLDFFWAKGEDGVALEVEGATWSGGRHVTGVGFRGDCQKYNACAICDIKVFRVTGDMLKEDPAGIVDMIKEALDG